MFPLKCRRGVRAVFAKVVNFVAEVNFKEIFNFTTSPQFLPIVD